MSNDNLAWRVFPYPSLSGGMITAGSLLDPPASCLTCTVRSCASDDRVEVGTVAHCRFGYSYARVDDERVVVGVLCTDAPSRSTKVVRRTRLEPERLVKSAALARMIERVRSLGAGVSNNLETVKSELLVEMRKDPQVRELIMRDIRGHIEQEVQQSHDFRQLAALINGYAEALNGVIDTVEDENLLSRLKSPGMSIHHAAQLIVGKIDALVFLTDPARALLRPMPFRVFDICRQYSLLYQWYAQQREVHLRVDGQTYRTCNLNYEALGTVIQALLDNLVKYAPPGSSALMKLEEIGQSVRVSFSSLGPRIHEEETGDIFELNFRGQEARAAGFEGQGIGLASARTVSNLLGLKLSVRQEDQPDSRFSKHYSTTFSLDVPTSD